MPWFRSGRCSGGVQPAGGLKAAATLIAVLVALVTTAAPPRNADLDRIRGEIARMRTRLSDVRAQTQTAERELEEVDLELGIRTRELEIATRIESDLIQELHGIENQIAALTPLIAQQKQFLSKRLAVLYRLGSLTYTRVLLSIDERQDPIEAMSMLTYLVSRDSRAITRFLSTREQLRLRYADLADRQRRLQQMRNIVEERRREVAATRAQKQRLLVSLRQQGTQSEKQLVELEEKAKRLERLIDVLSRQAGVAAVSDIRSVQGALSWPVAGKVIEPFGLQRDAQFSTVTFNNGVKIGAPTGTEVQAIFPGTVLFSQWFKGYGNLIILDHGNRVFSLYGNLKSPAVAVGERVAAGQTIAGVGESDDAQSGYLYFEIRQDNKPEDPQKWLR
jgi:septal ring factor EnvC (AmiA/AmiB activator)